MSESTNQEAQVLHLAEEMMKYCVLSESCAQSPEAQVLHLTEALTKYCVLFESCAQSIKDTPNKCHISQVYKEAVENWQYRSEFCRPSPGNEAARAKFFAAVDEVCKTESRALDTCYLITFVCSAAMQVIVDQDLARLCDSDRCYVLDESRRLYMERLSTVLQPTSNSSAAAARLPQHLVSAFFPETQSKQSFGELVGKNVRYRDPRSGKTREGTVTDQVTSYLKGTYYSITNSDGCDEEVSEGEILLVQL
ncbi:hypothetical protein F5887DRAFT_1280286 [Amanita rubescens]|nr:hypothetical protein F5887DRAFT_1280286 [Amanita rubescens]